ncbi:MAG: hypothetical protein JW889_03380 [Verrucomicrobia bacterium]|nr:hypothetical protein [Verrucomicrobiota bacterium]
MKSDLVLCWRHLDIGAAHALGRNEAELRVGRPQHARHPPGKPNVRVGVNRHDRLVAETRPHLLEETTDRLVLKERLRGTGQRPNADERMRLIAETFHVLAQHTQQRFSRQARHVDPLAMSALLCSFGLTVAFFAVGSMAEKCGGVQLSSGQSIDLLP